MDKVLIIVEPGIYARNWIIPPLQERYLKIINPVKIRPGIYPVDTVRVNSVLSISGLVFAESCLFYADRLVEENPYICVVLDETEGNRRDKQLYSSLLREEEKEKRGLFLW